jgi:hypothetical protein
VVISDWKSVYTTTAGDTSALGNQAPAVYASPHPSMIDSPDCSHLCHVLQVAVAVAYCGRPLGR